jgi:hypothetical protein
MKNISQLYNGYYTSEGIPFLNLSKSVVFPEDDSLDIYDFYYADDDLAWTIVSYKLYGTIDYWWVLTSLNKSMIFYAERGTEILIIHPNSIENILRKIK